MAGTEAVSEDQKLGTGSAFPITPPLDINRASREGSMFPYPAMGFTKREVLAAMAMQGLASNGSWECDHNVHQTAAEAVSYADALLKALAK